MAEREISLSKNQQAVMAMESDNEGSIGTRLTKGDATPAITAAPSQDISVLTGENRESKAADSQKQPPHILELSKN